MIFPSFKTIKIFVHSYELIYFTFCSVIDIVTGQDFADKWLKTVMYKIIRLESTKYNSRNPSWLLHFALTILISLGLLSLLADVKLNSTAFTDYRFIPLSIEMDVSRIYPSVSIFLPNILKMVNVFRGIPPSSLVKCYL